MNPLISAGVESPAKNAEHQLAASVLLAETVDSSHPSAAGTISRLTKINARRLPLLRSFLLIVVAVLTIAATVSFEIRDIRILPLLQGNVFKFFDILGNQARKPDPRLTTQQRLLLGDPDLTRLECAKQLHEIDPNNPAYYTEYILAYRNEHSQLPPDYFQTVARIAPNNSFFLYWAAAHIGGKSIEKKIRSGTSSQPRYSGDVKLRPLPVERDYCGRRSGSPINRAI